MPFDPARATAIYAEHIDQLAMFWQSPATTAADKLLGLSPTGRLSIVRPRRSRHELTST
jgi:hypothetical protein